MLIVVRFWARNPMETSHVAPKKRAHEPVLSAASIRKVTMFFPCPKTTWKNRTSTISRLISRCFVPDFPTSFSHHLTSAQGLLGFVTSAEASKCQELDILHGRMMLLAALKVWFQPAETSSETMGTLWQFVRD